MRDRYDEDRYRRQRYRDDRWHDSDDRSFVERASDEVRSWFGDEEAERRRRLRDDRDWDDSGERGWRDRERRDRDLAERNWRARHSAGQDMWTANRGDRDWPSQSWDDRGRRESGWREWDEERRTGPARDDYGYAPGDRSSWRRRTGGGDWRRDDNGERSWRGDYFNAYASDEAPLRVGGYAGRGPKGYQRSDARIQDDVSDRLADAPDVDASDISVSVSNGEVTLSGSVRDRWQKHRAEDLVEEISGVREVHNQLRVNREGQAATSTAATPVSTTTRRETTR